MVRPPRKGDWDEPIPVALTLTSYPRDLVRLACDRCGRSGQYRRETLIERFGRDAQMPTVLVALADCPRYKDMSNPCGAHYPDLDPNSARMGEARDDG
jgi:hypothetical protein